MADTAGPVDVSARPNGGISVEQMHDKRRKRAA